IDTLAETRDQIAGTHLAAPRCERDHDREHSAASDVPGVAAQAEIGPGHGSEAPPQADKWIGGSSPLDARPRRRPRPKQPPRRRVRKLASSVTTQALADAGDTTRLPRHQCRDP